MTTVLTYPWILARCGVESELQRLASAGVDGVAVAAHYHSVQTISPRVSGRKIDRYPGGCYFTPDTKAFADAEIEAEQNSVPETEDPLAAVCSAAGKYGLNVTGWTVCNHNTRLAERYPDYRIQSAFGTSHEHALCPSWPAVQEYFANVVRSIAAYDLDRIDLESIGFPSVLHGHGSTFGHAKDHVLTTPVEKTLFSQCFCSGCQKRARSYGLPLDDARDQVQTVLNRAMTGSRSPLTSFTELVEAHPDLRPLFEFRRQVIADFLDELASASGSVPLNYYVSDGVGRGATDGRPAGVDLEALTDTLDEVTSLCYTSDPTTAGERTESIRKTFRGTTHAAVTTDPDITDSEQTLRVVASAAHRKADGDLYVYNQSLFGTDHMAWLAGLNRGLI